jgi:hypothetical protein
VPDLPFLTPGLNARFRQRVERMAELRPGELDRALQQEIVRRAPFIIFLLLPFFAAVLKLLYRRRYYVEHMIFAVHLQTFAFMIFTAVLLVDAVPLLARLLLLLVRGAGRGGRMGFTKPTPVPGGCDPGGAGGSRRDGVRDDGQRQDGGVPAADPAAAADRPRGRTRALI